ncbi:hypothetical protein [Sphingopyxis sp. MG]|uniref:hypothetical protein n=1 Tax=Sphingopyxis sp. MG TaxID=1866325 RepID=UPI000CDF4078|nr:hypothetical protein [Sphingopyxis sp. MG]AVA14693.1 hypothetical protein C3E99_13245 [Sphingopyxis sp. MG]
MTAARYNVRVPAALDQALHRLAELEGLTAYAMLQRIVKAGIDARTNPRAADAEARELIAEVASMGVRLADIEHMVDRTLFTACAAYCYARSAAIGSEESDEAIAEEVRPAYERQRAMAEQRS